jgi:uncharacterized protein
LRPALPPVPVPRDAPRLRAVSPADDLHVVSTEAELRAIVGEPARAIAEKAIDRVDAESRRFIAASPLFLLGTTNVDGSLDVSPRGDPPGSVLMSDDGATLAFADRPGNRRLDSLRNVLRRPRAAGARPG